MRSSKSVLFLVVLVFVVVAASVAFAGPKDGKTWLWPDKEGEICLEKVTPGICPSCYDGELYMHVKKMGDNHYLVLGRYEENGEVIPFIGAAEIVTVDDEAKVRIHATISGRTADEVYGSMVTIFLDPEDLTGTLDSMDMNTSKTTADDYSISYPDEKEVRPCGGS